MKTELVVALDYPSLDAAEELISQLQGLPVIYKVGMELLLSAGPDWIKLMTESGERIFLDLKLHDIPDSVGKAVMRASELSPEFLTIHMTGGNAMLDEVAIRLRQAKELALTRKPPKIFGISVLSSFEADDWKSTMVKLSAFGEVRPIEESVLEFSALAEKHEAVDGIVCSPHEIAAIRQHHPSLMIMVAGIRPKGSFRHDQKDVMTPKQAKEAGASLIVVGRPISQAEDSRAMTESILAELDSVAA